MSRYTNFLIENIEKLNSLTKYPSILTYHELNKGGVTNKLTENKSFAGQEVEITEKVDGTNTRLVERICDNERSDYLVGGRERFEYAKGDRVVNSLIVEPTEEALKDIICGDYPVEEGNLLRVFYGECYGNKIAHQKQYVSNGSKYRKFRIFDSFIMDLQDVEKMFMTMDMAQIALWRDSGGQPFDAADMLKFYNNATKIARTPMIARMSGDDIPTDANEVWGWMQQFRNSTAMLNGPKNDMSNPAYGHAEGIVVRTLDRSLIRKFRFEDYEKGKKRGQF